MSRSKKRTAYQVKMDTLGRIVIPKAFRDALEIKPKSRLQAVLYKNILILTPVKAADDYGLTQIDDMGRVVIPAPYRHTLEIEPQQQLLATLVEDSVAFTIGESELDPELMTYSLISSVQAKLQTLSADELRRCLDLINRQVLKTA